MAQCKSDLSLWRKQRRHQICILSKHEGEEITKLQDAGYLEKILPIFFSSINAELKYEPNQPTNLF